MKIIAMPNRRWLFFVLFCIAFLLIAACLGHISGVIAQPGSARQKLVMVTSADYPPYEFRDTASGKDDIIGFDVDIAKYITNQLGYDLEIKDTDFSGIIPALQSRRADFAMAGMTPTEERKKNVDFSDIYYEAKNTIVTRKGSNLKTLADLAGKKVGVQLGSTQEKTAKEFKNVQLVALNKTGDLIQEVKARRIDAAVIEDTIAKGFIANNPDLQFSTIPSKPEEAGSAIAFPKNSPLVDDFNRVLAEMKQSGEIERLIKKWFENQGKTSPTTSPNVLPFAKIAPRIPFILQGILVTLQFTAISLICGFIWGTILSLFKISSNKFLFWFGTVYTSIFRGTPLLLQIALVYYATPQLTGYNIPALLAGVITFTLNSGAYVSETIRAGILAIDKGQREAALSLGIPYRPMMADIILPQAFKNILPALVNETIALLKDSSLVSVIGVTDLLRRAQIVGAEQYIYFEPLLFAGAIYYVMVMVLTWSGYVLERRLQRSS
ncbi:ABC transporter substrate-binding protein/permease [Microseira sp. BLCC-F43]|jgi:polar amino acid transport system substrate-binding protein|uniref:ABC transporter substrate-binding protein/permease n=1 Tax=Microseira sp. BLCC-F43 TaxID=3153602 RepID=UPI0035BBDA40